jgi:hypothetical protein
MIKEALQYLISLATTASHPVGNRLDTVYDHAVHYAPPPDAPPLARTLEVSTLKSLAGFVRANIDGADLSDHVLHVESPGRVVLRSRLEEYHRRREDSIAAVYVSPAARLEPDGAWFELADAVIFLMAAFTPQGQRDDLLGVLRSISTEQTDLREDDGMGQKVTVKAGVHVKGTGAVPNPVLLAPYRTFPEVDRQPESLFVVRLREGANGPQVLIKPADGGAWKVDAVERVADALTFALGDLEGAPKVIS